jgi:DNA-binding protein Fis
MIASAVLVENTDRLQLQSVGIPLGQSGVEASDTTLFPLSEMERRHIQNVLNATRGDRARAAEILGINLSTVYRKIKRYGI